MKKEKDYKYDAVEVQLSLKIDGKLVNESTTIYHTTSHTGFFTLDELAKLLYLKECQYFRHRTITPDILKEFEGKLECMEGETPDSVFKKYWLDTNKTIQEEFDAINKGQSDAKLSFFKVENDYLKYCLESQINSFLRTPLQVKVGFVYWLIKHASGSMEELQKDYDSCPQIIRDWIDQCVEEATKQNGKENPAEL